MLKTKSIHAPAEESYSTRILVTRFYPRGVRKDRFGEWNREIAPSANLLKSYRFGEIDGAEFADRLVAEMPAVGL